MKKIIFPFIISLLFNSCESPNDSDETKISQESVNETTIETKEEDIETHTISEDLKIQKIKNLVWSDLKNFKVLKLYMRTSKFKVWVDQMEDGSFRYASWSKSKTIDEKPDLILKNGEVTYEGSGGNHWYTFTNVDTKYICDINKLGKTNDDAFLIVKQGGKTIIDQPAKFISPFTKFIPKRNVSYFLENICLEPPNNTTYLYDKYIFTENIKYFLGLLINTDDENGKQLSIGPENKEISSLFKKSGYISFEDVVEFIYGIDNSIKHDEYHVNVYNPLLFDWVSSIVDDDDDLSYQKYFPYFSSQLKDLYKVYDFLNEKGIDEEAEKYMQKVKENEDCINYLSSNFGEEWVPEDINVANRAIYSKKAKIVGFWLRRHINGNSKIIYDLLAKILNKYEPNWSVDDWIIDEFDDYYGYYEPEGCSG